MKNRLCAAPLMMQRYACGKLAADRCSGLRNGMANQAGFTLMELMVVIAIVGIMATMAVPSFTNFIANSRVSSATNDLIADLMQARSLASTTGRHAVVCPSTNGTSCSATVSDWTVGRILFIDKNANGAFSAGDTLIKYTSSLPANLTITMTGFPNSYIAYNSYGGMFPLGTGTFTLCVKAASQARQLSVDYSGRPTSVKIAQSC